MPEGPEIYLASRFINEIGNSVLFGGRVVKSAVSTKNPDVEWDAEVYRVRAKTRGKELKMTLVEGNGERTLDILFRFGMSGSFKYTPVHETHKHAHLMFFTKDKEIPMVLSFVDHRRFGRWEVGVDWGKDRGPDPMWEYQGFRQNVLASLQTAAFKKPICEIMLNQKYFNGIGNYLRAEILYRCGVRPFDEAREILNELKPFSKYYEMQSKCEVKQDVDVKLDLLDLCHVVPLEVTNLGGGNKGYSVDPDADQDEYREFKAWLRCYSQDGMTNLVDHNRRTIWFSGDPGLLTPQDTKTGVRFERKKKIQKSKCNGHASREQNLDNDVIDKQIAIKREPKTKKSGKAVNNAKRKPQSEKIKAKLGVAKNSAGATGSSHNTRLSSGDPAV